MRKLFGKCVAFFLIIMILCAAILLLSTREPFRAVVAKLTNCEEYMDESGMLPAFEQAGQSSGATQLVIGDSICRQMFAQLQEYNPDKSILATNAALMMPGQYLLAKEYLENHPETTDVFLVMHPLTLIRTFEMEWGYRYAAMTYVETDNFQYLDEGTRQIMENAYGYFFLRKSTVWMIERSPICRKLGLSYLYFNGEPYVQAYPFEIADPYMEALYELCREKGVRLHLYSSPVSEYYREEMEALKEDYAGTQMSRLFPDYMENLWYYPEEWSEDKSHFSGEYAGREKLNEIIEQAYGDSLLGEILRLE